MGSCLHLPAELPAEQEKFQFLSQGANVQRHGRLRNKRWPNGIPSLRGVDALKVKLANKLYAFTRRVIDTCIRLHIPFICENPLRSWMWETTFFLTCQMSVDFSASTGACMEGQRLKQTALLLNFEASNLKLQCNGKHQHLPWGKTLSPHTGQTVFSTSTEAEYPWPLCKQLALAFAEQMRLAGKTVEPASMSMGRLPKDGSWYPTSGQTRPPALGRVQAQNHGEII